MTEDRSAPLSAAEKPAAENPAAVNPAAVNPAAEESAVEETGGSPRPASIDWDRIAIGSPCSRSWDAMDTVDGTSRDLCRFCTDCAKPVFDVASLSRPEAEVLITAHEGELCARLYRRPDGRLTTADCASVRRIAGKGRLRLAWVAAVLVFLATGSVAGAVVMSVTPETDLAEHGTFARSLQEKILDLRIRLGIDPEPVMILGDICIEEF